MSMKKFIATSAVAIGVFVVAGAASAATITATFQLGVPNNAATVLPTAPAAPRVFNDQEGNGLTMSVTGRAYNKTTGAVSGADLPTGLYVGGLGICSGTVTTSGDGCDGDNHRIDDLTTGTPNEMAILDFSPLEISITSISFGSIQNDDDFSFAVFGNGLGSDPTFYNANIDLPGFVTPNSWTFPSPLETGTVFGVGATSNSAFKLDTVVIEYEHNPPAVPLPAAGWMLIAGLGGMAAMKRRKKKS